MPAKSASGAPPADLRLDLQVRKYLKAVVFDANAFGRARPDLAFLEDLARRLHTIGIETWIPEPVAWEWAQHLAEDWQKVQTAMADERRALRRAGLAGHTSLYEDVNAVVEAFLERLDGVPHLTLIPLSPENALMALKDQILLIPPGRRKGEVKTGASDSAWLRAVLEVVEDDTGRLLIVSEDKDIQAAFEQWQKPCPLMRRRVHLKATMAEFILDDGGAENLIVQHLATFLGESPQDEESLSLGIAASPGLERLIASSLAEHEPDTALYEASLTRLTGLAGITDTYVEASSAEETDHLRTSELGPTSSQTALATIFFLADAEATVNRLYNGGDPQVDSLNYDDVLVRVPMSFDIRDGIVVAVRSEDEATVFLPDDGYADPGDAAAELRDALSVIPGLTLPETWPETSGATDLLIDPGQTPIHLEITEPYGEWRLHVAIGADSTGLRCVYDPDALAGDHEDQFYVHPPYQIEFDGQRRAFNPLWALNQWIIARI